VISFLLLPTPIPSPHSSFLLLFLAFCCTNTVIDFSVLHPVHRIEEFCVGVIKGCYTWTHNHTFCETSVSTNAQVPQLATERRASLKMYHQAIMNIHVFTILSFLTFVECSPILPLLQPRTYPNFPDDIVSCQKCEAVSAIAHCLNVRLRSHDFLFLPSGLR
jgi:hypothetical protein